MKAPYSAFVLFNSGEKRLIVENALTQKDCLFSAGIRCTAFSSESVDEIVFVDKYGRTFYSVTF